MNRITVNGDIKTDWFRPQPMGFFLFERLPGRYPALGQALDHTWPLKIRTALKKIGIYVYRIPIKLSRHSETTSEEGLVENGDIATIYYWLFNQH